MVYAPKEFTLKNGQKVILRSPEKEDAEELINQVISVAKSTDFLLSVPEDFNKYLEDMKKEEDLIEWSKTDRGHWLIACTESKIIANCSLRFNIHAKDRRCGSIGIAISEDYRGIGLGSILFDEMSDILPPLISLKRGLLAR